MKRKAEDKAAISSARSVMHREMRDSLTLELRRKRAGMSPDTLAEHLEKAARGELPLSEVTDLDQLSHAMMWRNAMVVDAIAQNPENEDDLRLMAARIGLEYGVKIAEHRVNARPERDSQQQRVVVVREQDMDAIERSLMAEAG